MIPAPCMPIAASSRASRRSSRHAPGAASRGPPPQQPAVRGVPGEPGRSLPPPTRRTSARPPRTGRPPVPPAAASPPRRARRRWPAAPSGPSAPSPAAPAPAQPAQARTRRGSDRTPRPAAEHGRCREQNRHPDSRATVSGTTATTPARAASTSASRPSDPNPARSLRPNMPAAHRALIQAPRRGPSGTPMRHLPDQPHHRQRVQPVTEHRLRLRHPQANTAGDRSSRKYPSFATRGRLAETMQGIMLR